MTAVSPDFYHFIKKLEENWDKIVPVIYEEKHEEFAFNVSFTKYLCSIITLKYLITNLKHP